MNIEAYFPTCPLDVCHLEGAIPRGSQHVHVLPHQREFIEAQEKYLALVGGYGGGKTLPAAILGIMLSQAVTGNRGIVCRRTYPKLHDPTERMFLEVLERIRVPYRPYEMRDGWPHRIVLTDYGSEIFFRETKDLGRFLGPEYGWFDIDEAGEEPESTFNDLTHRLRLGRAQHYLRGFITTNPPHQTHWVPKTFGEPGVKTRHNSDGSTTSFRTIRVSSRANPFLPSGYIEDIKARYPASEVLRVIEGHYGFSHEGRGVYTGAFEHRKHVGEVVVVPGLLVRSWDFGYRCPVILWHQFRRCRASRVHWFVHQEFIGENIEAEPLAVIVTQMTAEQFPTIQKGMIVNCGDAAGAAVSDKGPGPIIRLARPPYGMRFRYRHLPNIDPGIDLIRKALREPVCECGQATLLIDRRCRNVIDTLAGGYHYPRERPGTAPVDKPIKDGYYDNIADSLRYAAECFFRPSVREPGFWEELLKDQVEVTSGPPAWAWMTDER